MRYNLWVTIRLGTNFKFCPTCSNILQSKPIERENRQLCSKCGFILWNNPKPTTSIILEKTGKILLLQRLDEPFKGYWVLPGGYVEYNEEPTVTIKREAKEETGLDVTVDNIVSVYLIDTDPRGNSIDIVYSGKIVGGELKLKEHSKSQFFSPDNLPDLIAYKHREVITKWFENTSVDDIPNRISQFPFPHYYVVQNVVALTLKIVSGIVIGYLIGKRGAYYGALLGISKILLSIFLSFIFFAYILLAPPNLVVRPHNPADTGELYTKYRALQTSKFSKDLMNLPRQIPNWILVIGLTAVGGLVGERLARKA